MPKLPVTSGEGAIQAFKKLGYAVVRIRGSHFQLACHNKKSLCIPRHKTLGKGILYTLIKKANITVDEFISLLKD